MNTFKYLLLGSFFLASCSEQAEFKRPGETVGETVEVTTAIQVNVLPMQSIGSPATRSATGGKPEKGEAIVVTYGGDVTTRVQTGSDPMTAAESKINNAYIVQFNGTDPTSTAAWVSGDIKNQLGSGSPITCSFNMASGKKNRVYVVANCFSIPYKGMTLALFESPQSYGRPDTNLPSDGLPMSAMQDIGVGDAFDVFQLRSRLAKLTYTCKNAEAPSYELYGCPDGYSWFQSQPGDKAVRPPEIRYPDYTLQYGQTYYVPENLSGRNNLLIYPYTRALGMAPADAMYIWQDPVGGGFMLLLGDGSAPDFNFIGGYAYNINATIYGKDPYDLRVGDPIPVGTPIVDLNALAGGETANCYVAGAGTWYTFNNTVMGNGATTSAYGAANAADIIPSKLNPASADVLWETQNAATAPAKGDIVNNNLYLLKDRILFKSGSTVGNAVIAARDASGKIIWSWHIWRIDDMPSGIPLKEITDGKDFLASGIKMMDRNLGALEKTTSATVPSLGFLYQWGRKDPFPNTAALVEADFAAATNVNFNTDIPSTPASVATSVASPTTFYNTGDDWCTTRNDNYWGTPLANADITINSNTYDSNRGSKTIYDPCPPGWRVPPQYVYANAVGKTGVYNQGLELKGLLTASASLFLSATGSRTGISLFQGRYGFYWSSSVPSGDVKARGVYFNSSTSTLNANMKDRAYGLPVRCVQEY